MEIVRILKNGILAIFLLSAGISDLKWKKIQIRQAVIAAVLLFVICLIGDEPPVSDILGGMAVGAVLFILSRVTGGKLGEGDAYVVGVAGIGAGMVKTLQMLGIGLILAAVVSGLLLILRLAKRDTRLPFIPFLLVGYILAAPV